MNQAGTEHAHDVGNHLAVVTAGLFGGEGNVVQPGRGLAFTVGNHFHQQHAVNKTERFWHANAGVRQAVEGVYFGVQPSVFLLFLAIAGFLAHGPGAATVPHLAAFLVLNGLLETALLGLFIHLGTPHLVAAAHHKHLGFLAAHQLVQHLIDHAFIDEGL